MITRLIKERSWIFEKATLGITGLLRKRVQIECAVWHLDVGLAYPHECKEYEGLDCSSIKKLHELG